MTDKSFLSQLRFKFQIKKLPIFTDYVQTVSFPGISVGEVDGVQNPFQRLVIAGEHMTFDKLNVRFKLDGDMKNYTEIFDWMQGLGKPSNFDQYRVLAEKDPMSGEGPQVDASLTIMNAASHPIVRFDYYDMFPDDLSGFTLDYTDNDVQFVTADVRFSYRQYTYTRL